MGKWTRTTAALLSFGLGLGGLALASGYSDWNRPAARLGMPYVDPTQTEAVPTARSEPVRRAPAPLPPTITYEPLESPRHAPRQASAAGTTPGYSAVAPAHYSAMPTVTTTFVVPAGHSLTPQGSTPESAWTIAADPELFWMRAEYGLWRIQGGRLPPLFTTSPAGTPQIIAGVLGQPTTTVLIGGERLSEDARSAGHLTAGCWLDGDQVCALEGGFMIIESQGQQFRASSDGTQIIARPYLDAQTGVESAQFVSFPGLVAGTATVVYRSDPLYGANLDLKKAIHASCNGRVLVLGGYRYLRFDEDLFINENLVSLEPATLGTTLVLRDAFATRNDFHGGEIGLQAQFWRHRWSLDFLAKLAVGNVHRRVVIDGNSVITAPGNPPAVSSGGFAALSSNIGTHSSDAISLVPELGVTAGWQITTNLRLTLGYSIFWWTNIVRPGDQLDHTINESLLPPPTLVGPARPAFVLRDSDLWAQGVRFGVEYRY